MANKDQGARRDRGRDPYIEGNVVVSKPGALLEVREVRLTDAGRRGLDASAPGPKK